MYLKCFFYRSWGKLIINDKTVTWTFVLRNVTQKRSLPLPLPWRLSRMFPVPFFFPKIVKIDNLTLRTAIFVSNVPRRRVPGLKRWGERGENFSRLLNRPPPPKYTWYSYDRARLGTFGTKMAARKGKCSVSTISPKNRGLRTVNIRGAKPILMPFTSRANCDHLTNYVLHTGKIC